MAIQGYYIEYYGIKTDNPKDFTIIYIGKGKCLYVRTLFNSDNWATLSWVAAPTKKKIISSKNDITEGLVAMRYIYFKSHKDLMQNFENINILPIAKTPVNQEEEIEILQKIRKKKLKKINHA